MDRARSLLSQFQVKMQFFESAFAVSLDSQRALLDELPVDCPDLEEVVLQAYGLADNQSIVKNQFLEQYHILIFNKLCPMIHDCSTPQQHQALDLVCAQLESDPVLNAPDPVWVFFLQTFAALSMNATSPASLDKCKHFIQGCRRWSPDAACLTREAKFGLELVSRHRLGGCFYFYLFNSSDHIFYRAGVRFSVAVS